MVWRIKKRIIEFGNIDWRILKVKKNKMLVISEGVLETKAFNDNPDNNWDECSLKRYLNTDFLKNNFTAEEQDKILLNEVFLLSRRQVRKYMPEPSDRIAYTSKLEACDWWLRSSRFAIPNAGAVGSHGLIYLYCLVVDNNTVGVRPAMWLRLN